MTATMKIERTGWRRGEPDATEALVHREWLATNGLGGYASGTIGGVPTRRYHGTLVAALPVPLGRTMMLSQLAAEVRLPDGRIQVLDSRETAAGLDLAGTEPLEEFRLEMGLPVWRYRLGDALVEKRLFFTHLQNTVYVQYALTEGEGPLTLSLRPAVDFRSHDAPVGPHRGASYKMSLSQGRIEITSDEGFSPLRLRMYGDETDARFVYQPSHVEEVLYRIEAARGYESKGQLWTPGRFKVRLVPGRPATLVASTESWETLAAMSPRQAHEYELLRRSRLCDLVSPNDPDPVAAELALAADQFLILPAGRVADATRARSTGEELRTVIAGYHWFTDWGRDTMISLEGLTLTTGRHAEGRWILHAFAHYVREGLIPNLFPEGAQEGLYHTADASLWFFQAVARYLEATDDRATLRNLLPTLEGIVAWHRRGTRFGIKATDDGLLTQGSDRHPLTWMDAKCGDWIVTPRRGKPVEINALWYNALCLLGRWVAEERGEAAAAELRGMAARAHAAFNARFWCEQRGHCYDIVDGEQGDDPALRPNQLLAISLANPALEPRRWAPVLAAVTEGLLTPVGLRSLAPVHPDFKRTYHGDLRTRDAAYHQGTVWSWLIGPFVDAWLKVHPDARGEARGFLRGLFAHLGEAGIGSVSEVFDAEPPFTPRGCVAQAWGVAELLRAWRLTRP